MKAEQRVRKESEEEEECEVDEGEADEGEVDEGEEGEEGKEECDAWKRHLPQKLCSIRDSRSV